MDIKQRLKNNIILKNKLFNIVYWTAIALAFTISVIVNIVNRKNDMPYLIILLVAMWFYYLAVVGTMIAANHVIQNHRHSGILYTAFFSVVSIAAAFVVRLATQDVSAGIMIVFGAFSLCALIVIIFNYINSKTIKTANIMLFVLIFGFFWYTFASFLVDDFLGFTLSILAITAIIVALVPIAITLLAKKVDVESDSKDLLSRFDDYLDKVFKKVPATDNMVELREALQSKLIDFAKTNKDLYSCQDRLFFEAVDSLGDYSLELSRYKPNILARISHAKNSVANLLFFGIMQLAITAYLYTSSQNDADSLLEAIAILLFGLVISIVIQLLVRLFKNFQQKNHSLTVLIFGIITVLISLIINSILELEDNYIMRIPDIYKIIFVALVLIGTTSFEIISKRRFNKRNVKKKENE